MSLGHLCVLFGEVSVDGWGWRGMQLWSYVDCLGFRNKEPEAQRRLDSGCHLLVVGGVRDQPHVGEHQSLSSFCFLIFSLVWKENGTPDRHPDPQI